MSYGVARSAWKNGTAFVSPGTRLDAPEAKAIDRPSAETAGHELNSLASVPSGATETRRTPDAADHAKMSVTSFVSPVTRVVAADSKATTLPSDETAGWSLTPADGWPSVAETSVVVRVERVRCQICMGRTTRRNLVAGERFCPDAKATTFPSSETASEPNPPRAGAATVDPVGALTTSTSPVASWRA